MKKTCITLTIIIIIILTVLSGGSSASDDYLRIHIRANSNSSEDQSVKYLIKDAVVDYLAPLVANCDTKTKAIKMVKNNIEGINRVSDNILKLNGFNYKTNAKISEEEFPLRVYEDKLCLESGIYDALIVELGSAEGDNWWCVVYPPLCFTGEGEGEIKYRSKILEIIKDFINRQNN